MDKRQLLQLGAGLVLALPGAALAQDDLPASAPAARADGFTLAAVSTLRQPVIVQSAMPRAEAMPRDVPAVIADDARKTPGIDWAPVQGARIKLRPTKLRLTWGF